MSNHVGMDGHLHKELQDSVALQMVAEQIKDLKEGQVRNSMETKDEFRRIRDKIDELKDDVNRRLIVHDQDITRLTEKAKFAGGIAGAVVSVIIGLAIGFGKAFFQ